MAEIAERGRHTGEVVGLFLAPQAGMPMEAVSEVEAVAGCGLKGDRYFRREGTFSRRPDAEQQVTLFEVEVLEALAREVGARLAPEETRRNVLTRGVALDALVGRPFRVGEALLEGVRVCEPCRHWMRLAGLEERALRALVHRAGLRARIVQGGRIRVGDPVYPV